jgi:hypothetical protein
LSVNCNNRNKIDAFNQKMSSQLEANKEACWKKWIYIFYCKEAGECWWTSAYDMGAAILEYNERNFFLG